MPRYVIERMVGRLTKEELDAAGKKSNQVLAEMQDVVWIKSYVSEGLKGRSIASTMRRTRRRYANMRVAPVFPWTRYP